MNTLISCVSQVRGQNKWRNRNARKFAAKEKNGPLLDSSMSNWHKVKSSEEGTSVKKILP